MSGRDRLTLFPSRANLVLMKVRIAGAQKGLSLLKRKRDALEIHLRQLLAEKRKYDEQLGSIMHEALFSLARAKFHCTDFKPASVMQPDKANAFVHIKNTKTVGVLVPTWELVLRKTNAFTLTGLANGGRQVQVVREKFQDALKVLVAVASLQYSVKAVKEACKQNNKRVNGLEYVVLPRYQNTVNYIRDELDEFEREDFYRLKRSQAKQKKKKSDFIKIMREREKSTDATDPGVDFIDTYLKTPVDKAISTKPEKIQQESRKTVVKIAGNKVYMDTEKKEPFDIDKRFSTKSKK